METENNKYFVVLSQGAYSDYSPDYYIGDEPITQKELDVKGAEVGDFIISEFEKLPERPFSGEYNYSNETVEKYDPKTNKRMWQPGFSEWQPLMENWLKEKGYKKLPTSLPEINVSYSDIPHN